MVQGWMSVVQGWMSVVQVGCPWFKVGCPWFKVGVSDLHLCQFALVDHNDRHVGQDDDLQRGRDRSECASARVNWMSE